MMRNVAVIAPKKALTVLLLLGTAAMLGQQQGNLHGVVMVVSAFQQPRSAVSSSSSSLLSPFSRGSGFWASSKNTYDTDHGGSGLAVAVFPSRTCIRLCPTNNNLDDADEFSATGQGRNNEKYNNVDVGSSSLSSRIPTGSSSGGGGGGSPVSHVASLVKSFSMTMALCSILVLMSPLTPNNAAFAYTDTDYASETVQTTIKALKDAAGDPAATFKAYETLADIITEGSGLGGSVNFQGVTLDRGYIADEDTAIYNPGLTLLTESEKGRLVQAVIASRSASQQASSWSSENQLAFEFLREKLDPYHMQELSGYLGIFPYYAAVVYLAVLGVQQLARDFFPVAYFLGVAAVFGPAIALILLGPS